MTITRVTKVPGISDLNREGTLENRYYVYAGKGTDDKATVNLGMPIDTYIPDDVFNPEHSVGGVISEYIADCLRLDDDFPATGTLPLQADVDSLAIVFNPDDPESQL